MADIRKYGAVSPQVARKMAQGVRKTFGTTFGLATTGIAGPTGGSKEKPVGLVFIAVSDRRRTWVKEFNFKGNRREIKEKATRKAMQFFYETITEAKAK